nr:ATP-binding cassette domain-containing protein [Archaeoglobus veneficus]
MGQTFLEVNAEKDFGNFKLDAEFSMDRGYCVVLGPTGAGKSLLLEIIAGILMPDRGKVIIDCEDVTGLPPERRGIGFVPQDYALFPHMSVYGNIAYGLKARGADKSDIRSAVEEIAENLGISHLLDRKPATLSGGEKQRVALARALVIQPKLILLDEPLAAVDLRTKEKLMNELKFVHREFGIPVIHVTHSLIEAATLADEIAVMMNGRIVEKGDAKKVLSSPSKEVADFLAVKGLFKKLLDILD